MILMSRAVICRRFWGFNWHWWESPICLLRVWLLTVVRLWRTGDLLLRSEMTESETLLPIGAKALWYLWLAIRWAYILSVSSCENFLISPLNMKLFSVFCCHLLQGSLEGLIFQANFAFDYLNICWFSNWRRQMHWNIGYGRVAGPTARFRLFPLEMYSSGTSSFMSLGEDWDFSQMWFSPLPSFCQIVFWHTLKKLCLQTVWLALAASCEDVAREAKDGCMHNILK